jgi:hypothetical protein
MLYVQETYASTYCCQLNIQAVKVVYISIYIIKKIPSFKSVKN